MPTQDQISVVSELLNRNLSPDKAAVVQELARRWGVPQVPDAGSQMRAGALAGVGAQMDSADVPIAAHPYGGADIYHRALTGDLTDAPLRGVQTAVDGAAQTTRGDARSIAGGASKVFRGTMAAASPALLATGIAAPVETGLGLAGGSAASAAVEGGAKAVGVPDEYAALGGDVAGLVGGSLAAGKGGDLLQAVAGKSTGARDSLADWVRASAEKNIATALNPTTKVNKALVADKLAPGIIDRGMTAKSLADLQDQAQAGMEKHGQIIDDIFDQHAEAGTKISPKPLLAALETEKQNYTVDGEAINPAYVSKLTDMQRQVQAISDANDGAIPLSSLRRVRQIQDEIVKQSKGAFALPPDAQSAVNASKLYGNSIRSAFADTVPELVEPNREFNFNADLDKVVSDSLLRKTGQRAPLTQKLLETGGLILGEHLGGWPGALLGKSVGGSLGKLQNGALWNTLSAQAKSRLADLIASGDVKGADALAGKLAVPANAADAAGTGSQLGNESRGSGETVPAGTSGMEGAQGVLGAQGERSAGVRSAGTRINVPGGVSADAYPAQYSLRSLDSINASHNGLTFAPNAEYNLRNDRNYSNAVNQEKIVTGASPGAFDPSLHITDNPDATNGPVIVDAKGNVLGGNGRTMMLQRVYNGNPKGAAAYKGMLLKRAADFGLDPAAVSKMKQPVLVREVTDLGGRSPQDAVTDFNKVGTAPLTPEERMISDSRRVSPETLSDISGRLDAKGPEATVADVLAGKSGGEILQNLINDGIVPPQERGALQKENGELTPAGKARVTGLVVGRFFKNLDQLNAVAPAARARLERLAGPLSQVESKPDWNLTPQVQGALDLLGAARDAKAANLDDFMRQDSMFTAQNYGDKAVALARAIQQLPSAELTQAARQYATDAAFAAKGESMFGDTPTPEKSFADAFEKTPDTPAANALAAPKKSPANSLARRLQTQKGSLSVGGPEMGPHGPIFRDLSGKPTEAIQKLLQEKTGEVPGAFRHPDVGDIDLIWGKPGDAAKDFKGGYGLSHIIAKHVEARNDPNLEDLPKAVMEAKPVGTEQENRLILRSATHKAVVVLDWDGQAKKWLISAYRPDK